MTATHTDQILAGLEADDLEQLAALEAEQLGAAQAEAEAQRLELLDKLERERRRYSRLEVWAQRCDEAAEASAERILVTRRQLEALELGTFEAAGLGWRLATWTDDDGNTCEQLVAPGVTQAEHRATLLEYAGLITPGGEVHYRQLTKAEQIEAGAQLELSGRHPQTVVLGGLLTLEAGQ